MVMPRTSELGPTPCPRCNGYPLSKHVLNTIWVFVCRNCGFTSAMDTLDSQDNGIAGEADPTAIEPEG